MSKKSIIARNEKRKRLVAKYKEKREALKKILKDPNASYEDKVKAMRDLQKLPRDSAEVRVRNRCAITGRPRGYIRMFGICRNQFRQMALEGKIPGVKKASW